MKSVRTRITSRGSFDEPGTGLKIDGFADPDKPILYATDSGNILTSSAAQLKPFHCIESGLLSETVVTGAHAHVLLGSNALIESRSLNAWNSDDNRIEYSAVGDVYSIQFCAIVDTLGGNPYAHFDLVRSGSDPNDLSLSFRYMQSVEMQLRNSAPHQRVHATYHVVADQSLVDSGSIIMAGCTGGNFLIKSGSLAIFAG